MVARFFLRKCRLLAPVVLVLLLHAAWSTADELTSPVEFAVSGGVSDGPSYTNYAPSASAVLEAGPRWLRLVAVGSWTGLTKEQTPGGYHVCGSAGGKIYFGPFFATGGFSHDYTDQQVWEKTVQYLYGGGGYRWAAGRYTESGERRWRNQVAVTYWREAYSTYANDTTVLRFTFTGNRRIRNSPWWVRIRVSFSGMSYNEHPYPGAERRDDLGMTAKLGLAFMP